MGMIKASDLVAEYLVRHGTTHVFELIGGMTTHLIDSIAKVGRITIISMHHEQGAAFAADGHARMRGMPAVAMATSGPGATNLLTGIGSCYFDSVPAVFITGQVNRHEQKGNRPVRQLGFQETNIVQMATPVTKAAWLVNDPQALPRLLDEAFALAVAGRPGPVLLDIPMDVQCARIAHEFPSPASHAPADVDSVQITAAWDRVRAARRPLILAGGGIISAGAGSLLRRCLEVANIPVVFSLMAIDALPYSHPCRIGMIGSYGNRWANLAIATADLLLVLGSRLDVRQTGSDPSAFRGQKEVIHVDCDPGEVNNRVIGCTPIIAHLRSFLTSSVQHLAERPLLCDQAWSAELSRLRHLYPDDRETLAGPDAINPNAFLRDLSVAAETVAAICVDVGQHQMWAAQSWRPRSGQRFLTSGGMGSMGFSLPAAIGAACAAPGAPVLVVAGDGGFQCNIQELQTVRRCGFPIKMVVLNNRCHGMVRQFQERYFDGRYQSTLLGYSPPDFVRVAEAYGIPARLVAGPLAVADAIAWLMAEDGPALLEVTISSEMNVYPKLAFGRPFPAMEPDVSSTEMEGT